MEKTLLQVQEELLLAKQSRQEGNEGRARVCARRAAGAAAQGYFLEVDHLPKGESVIKSLVRLGGLDQIPDRVREAVNWLVARVDEDHSFPPEVDLIQEAGIVIEYIENYPSGDDQ